MIDYMLVVVLIGILVIIYRQMIKVDDVLDTIEHPDVLVIYEDQYKDIKKYENNENCKGLYLAGNFGCGKTYLISAMFNELAKKGVKSVTVYYPEFLRELKGRFGEDYNEVFNKVRKAPLLLLDDIGAETVTNWNRDEILGSLLQYRMQEGLPTFFTSNNTIKELEEHLIGSDSEGRVKSRRIIERIKYLTDEIIMVAENRRK